MTFGKYYHKPLNLLNILFFIEIRRLEKENVGISHTLERSEEKRINAEKLKKEVLTIIDDLPEGILIISKEDKVIMVNSRAEKLLNITRKKVLNKSILDLRYSSAARKITLPVSANSKSVHKEEVHIRENFILDLTIEPLIFDKNDRAKLVILRDITKTKYAEAAKNQFISVAAHQLKSPLSTVGLSLKMLLNQDFGKINKEQRDILEKTCKKNESLIYLVEDLLRDASSDEAKQVDAVSLVNLESLVPSVIDFYKDELKHKKITFKFNKPDKKTPAVSADPEKIKMVVQNLFDNAVKYTLPKGKIEVSLLSNRDKIEFSIKDSGMGIPEDQKEKIFKRFSRAANAIKSNNSGSGLGLAIAKDVIEKYRGKIWFQSKENEGSTFFFSLPITDKK